MLTIYQQCAICPSTPVHKTREAQPWTGDTHRLAPTMWLPGAGGGGAPGRHCAHLHCSLSDYFLWSNLCVNKTHLTIHYLEETCQNFSFAYCILPFICYGWTLCIFITILLGLRHEINMGVGSSILLQSWVHILKTDPPPPISWLVTLSVLCSTFPSTLPISNWETCSKKGQSKYFRFYWHYGLCCNYSNLLL